MSCACIAVVETAEVNLELDLVLSLLHRHQSQLQKKKTDIRAHNLKLTLQVAGERLRVRNFECIRQGL